MDTFDYFVAARVVHVLGVVLWIGGVAFVTSVLIPSLRALSDENQRFEMFEKLENRFSFQAKIVTLLTGGSGFFMLEVTHSWSRYGSLENWWLHMMTFIWGVFTLVLFVLEPLFLHRWFHDQAQKNPIRSFRVLFRMHVVLLSLSLIAVAGAVAGVHGG